MATQPLPVNGAAHASASSVNGKAIEAAQAKWMPFELVLPATHIDDFDTERLKFALKKTLEEFKILGEVEVHDDFTVKPTKYSSHHNFDGMPFDNRPVFRVQVLYRKLS